MIPSAWYLLRLGIALLLTDPTVGRALIELAINILLGRAGGIA